MIDPITGAVILGALVGGAALKDKYEQRERRIEREQQEEQRRAEELMRALERQEQEERRERLAALRAHEAAERKARREQERYEAWRQKWRRLTTGMTATKVKVIIGAPQRIQVDGSVTTHEYPEGGVAVFVRDQRAKKLTSWKEPEPL